MFARSAATSALRHAARSMSTSAGGKQAFSTARRNFTAGSAAAAVAAGASLYAFAQPTIQLEGPRTIAGEYKTQTERTFVMLKPDGTARQLLGKVISRFEEKGYKLVAVKSLVPSEALAKEHYADLGENRSEVTN